MSISKAYAKALYEASKESKSTAQDFDVLEAQLAEFAKQLDGSKELSIALVSPVTSSKEKIAVIEAISQKTGISKALTQFLSLLARKERMSLLEEISATFRTVRLEAEGGILGELVSADTLSESDIEGLSKAFGNKLGKRVSFKTSTDATLLAGIKITVNGVTYDGTLRSQLQQLRDRLVYGTTSAVN